METPKYLQVLWGYKWLLLVGAIVAMVAAFFAGFTIQNGQVVSRAAQTWSATTTLLITSASDPIYQAEIPGVPLQEGVSEPQFNDLAESALIYAYIISSDEIQTEVESEVGTLDPETESISAVRRTTQPAGDERFPGRYELPIVEVIGTAPTADQAQLISRTTADTFVTYLAAQQDAQQLAPELRVEVNTLGVNPAVEGETSNPAIPIVVTFFGVFLAFVVLAFILSGIRSGSDKRRAAAEESTTEGEGREPKRMDEALPLDDDFTEADHLVADNDLVGASSTPTPSRRARTTDDNAQV
ncbi:hypothetical protein ACPW96_22030 [Micromonospora sp. DT81.3]|uniref:hypothetical protein n=1 Tax=Micromonospora sp. DT81.3 TaxID=3416523 RepID=UPI003CE8111A